MDAGGKGDTYVNNSNSSYNNNNYLNMNNNYNMNMNININNNGDIIGNSNSNNNNNNSERISRLYDMIQILMQIAQEQPDQVIFLCSIAEPNVQAHTLHQIIVKMFEEVPLLLQQISPLDLQRITNDLPPDMLTLRLLFNLESISLLFQQMTYLQLLHLTNNVSPGPLPQQLSLLSRAQDYFKQWSAGIDCTAIIRSLHADIAKTSLQFERKRLLELQPSIPWELLQFFVELLKLPIEELLHFSFVFTSLSRSQLLCLLQILTMDPYMVFVFKSRFATLFPPINPPSVASIPISPLVPSASPLSPPLPTHTLDPISPPTASYDQGVNSMMTDDIFGLVSDPPGSSVFELMEDQAMSDPLSPPQPYLQQQLQPPQQPLSPTAGTIAVIPGDPTLRVARQPPPKTVYQRILKPPPSIMLVGPGVHGGNLSNYFVEATLVRSDSDAELPACIDGTRVERVSNGVFATFKKIKLLSTSQQQGTLFRLKFVLKKYVGNVFQVLPKSCIYSEPIEVFSHTQYLNERQDAPDAIKVNEVLPTSGSVGTRLVILGNNFVNGTTLRARFGQIDITPTFHERGTLICTVPPRPLGTLPGSAQVQVNVSNDGVRFSDSKVTFTYVS